MRVRELMRTDVVTIEATETASSAWSRMRKHRIRHLVVTDDGSLIGVISERDLGGRSGDEIRKARTVRELMSPRIVSATPTMTLREAANLMRGRLIGSLPVLESDRLSRRQAARAAADRPAECARRRNGSRTSAHTRQREALSFFPINLDATVNAGVDGALAGVERAVRRVLQRRRMKLRRAA